MGRCITGTLPVCMRVTELVSGCLHQTYRQISAKSNEYVTVRGIVSFFVGDNSSIGVFASVTENGLVAD